VPAFVSLSLRRVALVLLFVVPLAGCGLADYEAKMIEAQRRGQRLEEEFKNLDEPLTLPTRKEDGVETPLANLFLRPPRGISSTCEPTPLNGLIYRYPQQQVATNLPAGVKPIRDVHAVSLAFGNNRPDFTNEVLRNFAPAEKVHRAPHEIRGPSSATAAVYDVLEFDDVGYSYSIYVGQYETTQVAVIYTIRKGQRSSVSGPLTLSMESLAFGADADRARRDYAKQRPAAKK
jgi:hypothetical protein